MKNFKQIYETICRMLFWGWKMRNSYDWDSGYLYEMLELKLTRMLPACYEDGNHVWSPKSREYKALKECIELCKLIQNPPSPNMDRFEAEFGPGLPYRYEKCEGRPGFRSMHNDNSPFYKKQRMIAYRKDEALEKSYKQRLHEVMAKWSSYWWD